MRTLILFGILSGLCSANRNISIPGIPANYLQSPKAQAAICLLPKTFINFVQNLKAQDILQLAQLQSKLQQLSQTSQAPSHQQIVNLFNSSAPQVYKQLVQLANPFKTKAKNLLPAAQQFLTNLQQRSEELKANQNQTKTNFTILHNFFQEIYTNFTSLDNASRKAITGFFPTLSHIFGSQQFVNYLKACANATSFAQLSPINQQFGDYVTAHACDKQSSSNSKK